jgi:hypothetical protein
MPTTSNRAEAELHSALEREKASAWMAALTCPDDDAFSEHDVNTTQVVLCDRFGLLCPGLKRLRAKKTISFRKFALQLKNPLTVSAKSAK